MKLSMGLYEFTGNVRPVLPLEHAAECQHEIVQEEAKLVDAEAELAKEEAELTKKEASRRDTQAVPIWRRLIDRLRLQK